MVSQKRRWLAPTMLLAALGLAGCGPGDLLYYVMPPSCMPPLCALIAPKDKNKESRAMVLVYPPGPESSREIMQADRDLPELLVKHLREQFKENKEKVFLISPRQVEDYKNKHPEWKELQPLEIAKIFKVDFVIVLEMDTFTLHADGRQMYRGQTSISITLVNTHKEGEAPEHKDFNYRYPNDAKMAVDLNDMQGSQFRNAFLEAITKRLTRYFAAYPQSDTRDLD